MEKVTQTGTDAMKPTVLLFDLDGTLLTTGGVGRRALERAYREAFGRSACDFRFDGMTDKAIVRQGLESLSVPATQEAMETILELYLKFLEEEVSAADVRTYHVHPGMHEALDAASKQSLCAVGLGTGNVRRGAYVKLAPVKLAEHFPFGGFGCDHEDRPELIRKGAERGAAQLGVPLADCRVVVIGDTPKDIAAAQAVGAESLGVATGSFSTSELVACGATFAFDNLRSPGALEALLNAP